MTKDKTIEEIINRLKNSVNRLTECEKGSYAQADWYLDITKDFEKLEEKLKNYTPKDQVQAECEKYLDAFKEIMRESPTIGKHEFGRFWELLDKFKKEQREHE